MSVRLIRRLEPRVLFLRDRLTYLGAPQIRTIKTPTDKDRIAVEKTPQGSLDRPDEKTLEDQEAKSTVPDPYRPFPDEINPETGEKCGPRGPEPTRYGDWERKGLCVDF